jgi:hypothetical protein
MNAYRQVHLIRREQVLCLVFLDAVDQESAQDGQACHVLGQFLADLCPNSPIGRLSTFGEQPPLEFNPGPLVGKAPAAIESASPA